MMKISWITPSNFVDVDLPILAELTKEVEVYWQVISWGKIEGDVVSYIDQGIGSHNKLKIDYVEIPYRFYDLRVIGAYKRIFKNAKSFNPDLFYTSFQAAPYGPLVYRLFLPLGRTIAACHNVSTPKGANQETYARVFTDLHLRTFHNIQVFSETQRDILLSNYPQKNVLFAPLAIKDYGEPTTPPRKFDDKNVVFLFFGMILSYKRVDLLIDAAQSLYEIGYKNFKVKIAGNCKNWEVYEPMIKYPEIFENRIERIPNEEVADLFAAGDYFVMPYQDIAQSGAITVAYRYNLPIIVSDLPQFKPFVEEGFSGLFFKKGSVQDLEEKMKYVLEEGSSLNVRLRKGLSEFVEKRYSTPAIATQYMHYFKQLLSKNSNK